MKGFKAKPAKVASGAGVDTLVGQQTEILGDVRFTGGLHVEGRIKGSVSTESSGSGALWVSETGVIEGDVTVPNVAINGSVTGDVHASQNLNLAAKAKVVGNVHYRSLQMEPGAEVNGQLVCESKEAKTGGGAESSKPRSSDTVLSLHDKSQGNNRSQSAG